MARTNDNRVFPAFTVKEVRDLSNQLAHLGGPAASCVNAVNMLALMVTIEDMSKVLVSLLCVDHTKEYLISEAPARVQEMLEALGYCIEDIEVDEGALLTHGEELRLLVHELRENEWPHE